MSRSEEHPQLWGISKHDGLRARRTRTRTHTEKPWACAPNSGHHLRVFQEGALTARRRPPRAPCGAADMLSGPALASSGVFRGSTSFPQPVAHPHPCTPQRGPGFATAWEDGSCSLGRRAILVLGRPWSAQEHDWLSGLLRGQSSGLIHEHDHHGFGFGFSSQDRRATLALPFPAVGPREGARPPDTAVGSGVRFPDSGCRSAEGGGLPPSSRGRRRGLGPKEPPAALTSPPSSQLDFKSRERGSEGKEAGVALSESWPRGGCLCGRLGTDLGSRAALGAGPRGPTLCSVSAPKRPPAPDSEQLLRKRPTTAIPTCKGIFAGLESSRKRAQAVASQESERGPPHLPHLTVLQQKQPSPGNPHSTFSLF